MEVNTISFLTEFPYGFDTSGASSTSSYHLVLLAKAFPKSNIHILYFNSNQNFWLQSYTEFLSFTSFSGNISIHVCNANIMKYVPIKLKTIATSIFKLDEVLFKNIINISQIAIDFIKEIYNKIRPDIVWCEHLFPLMLPQYSGTAKLIYVHHDFISKILLKRRFNLKNWVRSRYIKRIEEKCLKNVEMVITGNSIEHKEILSHTRKNCIIHNIPILYPPLSQEYYNRSSDSKIRIIHLGTISATANRKGLKLFCKESLPYLDKKNSDYQFIIIGITKDEFEANIDKNINTTKFIFKGKEIPLEEIIKPYDIHVLPYMGKTGVRTKLYNLLRFKSAILGYKQSVGSIQSLNDGEDIFLVKNIRNFNKKLIELCMSFEKRKQMSEDSFRKFSEHFSIDEESRKLSEVITSN
ncbi:MAG: glycosyltransferase [Fimbriimonadaceae bacterium]|nr:glycosyltransferase [Chitinophagales bacterium]